MRILLFVSVFGILVSIAVLILVLIKAKQDGEETPRVPKPPVVPRDSR